MLKHFVGQKGLATRFIRNYFDGPFTVIGSYNQRSDLLKLRALNGDILPVNVEKLAVLPYDNESNIRQDDLAIDYEDMEPETVTVIPPNRQN